MKSSAGALALDEERSIWRIVGSALVLYGRYPLLFAILAVVVVAPYDMLALSVAERFGGSPRLARSAST